jgi:hypothetical protein
MTLIVAIIMKHRAILIADRLHIAKGTENNPVKATIKAENTTIQLEASSLQYFDEKVYRINESTLLAGAGDTSKIKKFVDSIARKTEIRDYAHQYYCENKIESPQQLIIITRKDSVYFDVFQTYEFTGGSGFRWTKGFEMTENGFLSIAIGSGQHVFQKHYQTMNEDIINSYQSLYNDSYDEWEKNLLVKMQELYIKVSQEEPTVGPDIVVHYLT